MKVSWVKGLTPEQKDDITRDFKSNTILRERLQAMLMERRENAQKKAMAEGGYEVANWAYKQADCLGYQRAMQEIIDLLK